MSVQRRVRAGRAALHAYADARKLPNVERLQPYTISDAITDLLYYAASRKLDINGILLAAANGYVPEIQVPQPGATVAPAIDGEAPTGPEPEPAGACCVGDCPPWDEPGSVA